MKRLLTACLLGLAMLTTDEAIAAAKAHPRDAVAMLERGAAYMKAHGKQALIKKIKARAPDFVQGSLYLSMRDIKTGVLLAHPGHPSLVGKKLLDVPDADGKHYRREIIIMARRQGKGWVDHRDKNPLNGQLKARRTYLARFDDVVLEADIYKK